MMSPGEGKTILVTRGANDADETIERFEREGANVIHIPLIEIADPSDRYASFDRALGELYHYQWILFTSRNAVTRFFSRPLAPSAEELSQRIAAVGPATSKLLCDLGIQDPVVAVEPSAEGLLRVLEPYDFSGKRILFPRAKEGRDLLADGLRQRGAIVDVVEASQTIFPKNFDQARFISLIEEGKIDVVHFASPSAVRHFMEALEGSVAPSRLMKLAFIAIGPTTAEALRSYGFSSREQINSSG